MAVLDTETAIDILAHLTTVDGFIELLPALGFPKGFWKRQEEVFRAVAEYPQVYVRTGHSTGKTFLAGAVGVWFLLREPHTKVVYLATKLAQVKRQAWAEFLRIYGRIRKLFPFFPEPHMESVTFAPDWFATVWAGAAADPEAFRGFHAPHLLVVIDEASGVSDQVREAIEGCLTSPGSRLLALSNPTRRSGWFYEHMTKPSPHRALFHISSLECLDAGIPGLATREWVERVRADYGEDSPFWQYGVLGEFPVEAENALIPWWAIQDALERWKEIGGHRYVPREGATPFIGVDVARSGTDATVIVALVGNVVYTVHKMTQKLATQVTAEIRRVCEEYKTKSFAIDASAPGWGPMDFLRAEGYEVREFISNARPTDRTRFVNLKAEVAWSLRERFIRGEIAIPHVPELIRDLSGWRYEFVDSTRLRLIDPPKSPDAGDALLIAHWAQTYQPRTEDDQVREIMMRLYGGGG